MYPESPNCYKNYMNIHLYNSIFKILMLTSTSVGGLCF